MVGNLGDIALSIDSVMIALPFTAFSCPRRDGGSGGGLFESYIGALMRPLSIDGRDCPVLVVPLERADIDDIVLEMLSCDGLLSSSDGLRGGSDGVSVSLLGGREGGGGLSLRVGKGGKVPPFGSLPTLSPIVGRTTAELARLVGGLFGKDGGDLVDGFLPTWSSFNAAIRA